MLIDNYGDREMDFSSLYLILSAVGVFSPLLIFLCCGRLDPSSLTIGGVLFMPVAVLPAFVAPELSAVVWKFFFLQFLLFFAFVSVSRMRQRKSSFLHALASIPSNGQWFLAMWVLSEIYLVNDYAKGILGSSAFTAEFFILLATAIAATVAGRLVGVQWMQWAEAKWEVKTESVGSEKLKVLDRHTPKALLWSVAVCFGIFAAIYPEYIGSVALVMLLGLVQNGIYALNTRLANRNHPGWPVVTGLVGGVVFIVHWTYLVGYAPGGVMPLMLLVPYIVATVAGSNFGALVSMLFERMKGIKADEHVHGKDEYKNVTWHRGLLWSVAVVCGAYIIFSVPILTAFDLAANDIILPVPATSWLPSEYARTMALVLGGMIFFVQNSTHTLSSRAGNRNHALFHATACVLHGTLYFLGGTFVILNASFVDLIPVAALGGALGQLFAQRVSMRIERRLESVMDVPNPAKA